MTPVALKSAALALRLSSTSDSGPVMVLLELLVTVTVCAKRPVLMFKTNPLRVTVTELVTSVAPGT